MRLPGLLETNAKTKLMALLMATGVWLFAYSFSRTTIDSTAVPLRILTPANWVVSGDAPKTVHVKINFPIYSEERVRQALRPPAEIACEIPINLADEGGDEREKEVEITPESFRVPPGIQAQVVPVEPLRLRLAFAREVTRPDVPVEVRLGKAPPGLRIEEVWPWPQRVAVSGPKSVLDKIRSIRTRMVRIDDVAVPRDMKIEGAANIDPKVEVDGVLRNVKCDERIEYKIFLSREPVSKEFDKIPIQFLVPPDYPFEARHAGPVRNLKITVTGPESVVNSVKPEDILLFIDVNRMTPSPGQKQYQSVQWKIVGVDPGEHISVEGVKQDVPVEVVPRPKSG